MYKSKYYCDYYPYNTVLNIGHSIDENGDFYTVEFLAMGVEKITSSKTKDIDF